MHDRSNLKRRRPTIVIADDHALVADSLRSLLEKEFDVVDVVHSGDELIATAVAHRPDAIVADINMPGTTGIDAAEQIAETLPETKVILISMSDEPTVTRRALECSSAFVSKFEAGSELIAALHVALGTELPIDEPPPDPHRRQLTPRQIEVLRLIVQGKTMKEIGNTLNMTPRTVAFHKYRIMDSLKVKTSAELVARAVALKLVG